MTLRAIGTPVQGRQLRGFDSAAVWDYLGGGEQVAACELGSGLRKKIMKHISTKFFAADFSPPVSRPPFRRRYRGNRARAFLPTTHPPRYFIHCFKEITPM